MVPSIRNPEGVALVVRAALMSSGTNWLQGEGKEWKEQHTAVLGPVSITLTWHQLNLFSTFLASRPPFVSFFNLDSSSVILNWVDIQKSYGVEAKKVENY